MKGFPNQVAELGKIGVAIRTLVELIDANQDARDDGVFGQALVRSGVAGTGHRPQPIEQYIQQQLQKSADRQSFRTTARGLRELFRLMALIDDSHSQIQVTDLGREAARISGRVIDAGQIEFWRGVINNIVHSDTHGVSHPYQMLLRLVARVPGITRAKCALALEARNDSREELDRIATLARRFDEEEIVRRINVTTSNWDNAKKVLPKFAEQLGDVIRTGQTYVLASRPGGAAVEPPGLREDRAPEPLEAHVPEPARVRPPRDSREVTPETIGAAGTVENFDELTSVRTPDASAALATANQRRDRLRRHNLLVRLLAERFRSVGARLYEAPFDMLAVLVEEGVLAEVKSLDGSSADERDRVMEAFAQLLYYEAFLNRTLLGEASVIKVACFEKPITSAHQEWLNSADIASIWLSGTERFDGDELARRSLRNYVQEFR